MLCCTLIRSVVMVYDKNSRLQRRQVSKRHSLHLPPHHRPSPPNPGSATWSQSRDQGCYLEGFIFPFHTLTQNRKKDLCRFRKFDSEALLNLLHLYCFGPKHSEFHSPWGSLVRQCRSVGEDSSMVFGEIPISTIRRWGYNPFLLSLHWGGTR